MKTVLVNGEIFYYAYAEYGGVKFRSPAVSEPRAIDNAIAAVKHQLQIGGRVKTICPACGGETFVPIGMLCSCTCGQGFRATGGIGDATQYIQPGLYY